MCCRHFAWFYQCCVDIGNYDAKKCVPNKKIRERKVERKKKEPRFLRRKW